jgi:epoxyqueuosine reductase
LDLDELLATPDEAVLGRFTGTPLRRPGAGGLKRNALIALGNLGDREARPAILAGLRHPEPRVRAAAIWAARRLDLGSLVPTSDPDPMVQAEICGPEPST